MLSALRLPGLRWLLGLHGADLALEYASSVALMVLVYDATDSPIAAAAMLVAKQIVPGALLALRGGLLDGVDARGGLAAAYALRAAAFACLALLGGEPPAALYALAFIAGTAGTASRVLIRATVARTLSGEQFRSATAAQNLIFGVMTLAGPAAGALVAGAATPAASILVWAALALAMAGGALGMPRALRAGPQPEATDQAHANEPPAGTPRALHASATSMLALAGFLAVAFAMDEPALLAYVRESLDADTSLYGTILVAWGAGVIAGGLIYSRFGVGAPIGAIIGGVGAAALGYIGLGFAPTPAAACAAAVLGGIGNGVYWVALVTAVLGAAPAGDEARVSGRLEGLATAMPALGIVLGGVVAEWVDPRVTLWLPGFIALGALAAWSVIAIRRPTAPAQRTSAAAATPDEVAAPAAATVVA